MKFQASLCTLALCLISPLVWSADTVSFDQANPPFMYGKDGKAAGIYPALINAAFLHMKTPVTLQALPWARAIQEIDQGNAGVGGIYKNAEREKKYDYSEQIFVEKLAVYVNKGKPINFSKVEDLKGKRIGVIRGWSYGDDFDNARKANAFTVEEVPGDDQNFGKLDVGRLDAVVAVAESGDALTKKYTNVQAAPTPLAQNPTYLAFAKSANKADVLKKFNDAIKEMKANGELNKLVAAEVSK